MSWEYLNHVLSEMHQFVVNFGILAFSILFIGDLLWRKLSEIRKRNGRKPRR
jgi:hypothetical protein